MKHIGSIIKKHIEDNGIKKGDVAKKVGITYNYLSTIFTKATLDASLLERICVAIGLNPAAVFELPESGGKSYSDISATTMIGDASVRIGQQGEGRLHHLLEEKERIIAEKDILIAEKERTIKILLAASKMRIAPDTAQDEI